MKKYYEAPAICFEDFSLSTSIAGSCERIVGNPMKGTCAIESSGGVNIFTGNMNACDTTPEGMRQPEDQWDGFCYHVPTELNNLFNS